jgi:hypothetical protein
MLRRGRKKTKKVYCTQSVIREGFLLLFRRRNEIPFDLG